MCENCRHNGISRETYKGIINGFYWDFNNNLGFFHKHNNTTRQN